MSVLFLCDLKHPSPVKSNFLGVKSQFSLAFDKIDKVTLKMSLQKYVTHRSFYFTKVECVSFNNFFRNLVERIEQYY